MRVRKINLTTLGFNFELLSRHFFAWLLLGAITLVGCGPEMPVPPPRESINPAVDDFDWAMERLKRAFELFQPPTSLGLSVKRDLEYKLIEPSDSQPNYVANVTVSTRAIFNHDVLGQRRPKNENESTKLDDPYVTPENAAVAQELGVDVPAVTVPTQPVADARIPAQKYEEKKDYILEYKDNRWQLKTESLEENEKMWFDYALQQGEFAPGGGGR